MKNGLVISDAGPIFSLATIDRLDILLEIFDEVYIPRAVWLELTLDKETIYYQIIVDFLKDKVREIQSFNDLSFIMDFGESESVVLYRELQADFLLIDDRKARQIAESLGARCVGTIGVLLKAKEKGIIQKLKPLFEQLLSDKRYYSLKLLNEVLRLQNEDEIG